MNEFYVGYLPKAPTALARFLRRIVVGLGFLTAIVALVLVTGQMPFANATFEYGKARSFEGIIALHPYPTLLVSRPGQVSRDDARSEYLLVAPGKHGADELLAGFEGQQVRLQGSLIFRDGQTMVEVMPGSLASAGDERAGENPMKDLGPATIAGEIVDSKCYLGVMNPGKGKVHRDCAARCLGGGIPPIFVSGDRGEQYVLVDFNGRALGRDALREFIAEPITVEGALAQRGSTLFLKIDPGKLRHSISTQAFR